MTNSIPIVVVPEKLTPPRDRAPLLVTVVDNASTQRDRMLEAFKMIALVGSLTLTAAGGGAYGSLRFYGVTKVPSSIIGILNELLYSVAWCTQLIGIIDALLVVFLCSYFNTEPHTILPLIAYLCGLLLFTVHLLLFEYAYWFNEFEESAYLDLEQDNLAMFLADGLPTLAFFLIIVVLVPYRYMQHRAP